MGNATIVNFASGETSPKSRGRFDIASYNSSCRKLENFIAEVNGSARYRPGFKNIVPDVPIASTTRVRIIPFTVSNSAAYILKFVADLGPSCLIYVYDESGTLIDGITSTASLVDFNASELPDVQFTQSGDSLYITHPNHFPRVLTRDYLNNFSVAFQTRTNDPFPTRLTITGWTRAAAGEITLLATITDASLVRIYFINGDPAADGNPLGGYEFKYRLVFKSGTTYYVKNAETGAAVNTTGWEAYSTTSYAVNISDMPAAVAFYENRLVYFATRSRPNTLFLSRSPVPTTGATRYADFTGGTDADHACFFSLAPSNGRTDFGTWLVGLPSFLLIGTLGGVYRASGGGVNEPITPTSISVRQIDANGCAYAAPAVSGPQAFFVQRGGKLLRSFRYEVTADDYVSEDELKNAEQLAYTSLSSIVYQTGVLDRLWVKRSDGTLACATVQKGERVMAWHRFELGGVSPSIMDMAVLPQPGGGDQFWVYVTRTVNGGLNGTLERLSDEVIFPDIEDYFTAAAAGSTDAATYRAAVVALLKTAVHLDSYETYDSTPATVISGLSHLIGETVTAVADGVEHAGLVVSAGGAITLPAEASIVHVGLPYTGLLQTQNLEVGGRSGPAQAKPRNINALNIRFLNSKGGKYGTDLYHMFDIDTEDPDALELADGSSAPVFNGIRALQYSDVWSTETDRNEKTVFIQQTKPFPCVVQFIDIEYETGDE